MIDFDRLRDEYTKCYQDKSRIYMTTHYLKTYDATQRKEVPFTLFPRQKAFCEAMGSGNNVVLTKPRQAGCTTTAGGFIACEMVLADPDSPQTVLAIGNTLDLAQQMLFKIRDFLLQFPLWMWGDEFVDMGYDITKPPTNKNVIFDVCNGKELKLKNGCKVVARSSGPDASRGVGGVTWLIFDEAAFIENGRDVYASAIPTVSTGGHIIMISTPNGKDLLYYETCRLAKLKGTDEWNNFELVELKWYQDPRYNKNLEWLRKDKESGEVIIKQEPTLDKEGNIKFDSKHWEEMVAEGWKPRSPWYTQMCQQFNNDEMKIAQELDVSFLGSASNVVAPEFIDMQRNLNNREPLPKDSDGDMFHMEETWVWKPPIPGHRYLCACLPEGEIVKTSEGNKKIETIVPIDKLINRDGKIENIIECKRRYVQNEDIYSIRISNVAHPMKFTGNHPLYVSDGTLKRWYSKTDNSEYAFNERYREHNFRFEDASNIKIGQWLCMPNFYYNNFISNEELQNKLSVYGLEDLYDCTDFWWYCGLWVAEGYCNDASNNIDTTHNINETNIHLRAFNFIESILGKHCGIRTIAENNATHLFFNSSSFKRFLIDSFGKGAKNKHIPEFVKKLPSDMRRAFISGYLDGDGSLYENARDGILISFGSVSYELLSDLQDIFFGEGVISCLSLSHKGGDCCHFQNRIISTSDLYELKIQKVGVISYLNKTEVRRPISSCYFSKDYKYIYFKIKDIIVEKYSGYVYNFETQSHTFCTNRCITHNCDPSRGDAADRTAIEILDMDGRDENNQPILEQVLEYQGKRTGDEIGEMIYWYAKYYGDAFTVVECIGGVGDATVLTLQRLGYKNLFYDDPNLKTYTIQREASSLSLTNDGKLPGFHSSSVRFQMLTFFANMVKTNQIKIRSKRVISELDTWIYKGDAARIDHQDGCHDDTLTCLAMATFVMTYHLGDLEKAKERDAAFLQAWINSSSVAMIKSTQQNRTLSIDPKPINMPFYSDKTLRKSTGNPTMDSLRWLIS